MFYKNVLFFQTDGKQRIERPTLLISKESEDKVEISSLTNKRYVQVFRNSIFSFLIIQLDNSAATLL